MTTAARLVLLASVCALLAACGTTAAADTSKAPQPSAVGALAPSVAGSPLPTAPASPRASVSSSASTKPPTKAATKPPVSSGTRTKDALSGVGAADRDAWATWRGHAVQINETWNDAKDSNGVLTWEKMDGLYSTHGSFSDGKWKGKLSIAQPMFAQNETMQSCATSSEISTWAKDLKAAWPAADAYIRLDWEFNGNWYTWKAGTGDAKAFKACWIKWYGLVKAVSSKFKLVWNPNNQSSDSKLDVRDFWPGKAYVDAAGPDGYALGNNGTPISPEAKGPNGEPLGISAWADWVAKQGVPFAVPEWAIREQSYGSTSPVYIDQMRAAFVKAAKSPTGLAYESYFDGGSGYQCQFSIHDTSCPGAHAAAAAEYKKLWSKPYVTK